VAPKQVAEFVRHGAARELQGLLDQRFVSVASQLSADEEKYALTLADQIAAKSAAHNLSPVEHLPEAEMLVIALRPALKCEIVLLDEKAARTVAGELGLRVTGFPGILARAGLDGLLSSEEIRRMLKQCQRQGTHYSNTLIESVAKTYGR